MAQFDDQQWEKQPKLFTTNKYSTIKATWKRKAQVYSTEFPYLYCKAIEWFDASKGVYLWEVWHHDQKVADGKTLSRFRSRNAAKKYIETKIWPIFNSYLARSLKNPPRKPGMTRRNTSTGSSKGKGRKSAKK